MERTHKMRIIKPYGRSKTTEEKTRLLTLKPEYKEEVAVLETLSDDPNFNIASWISAIDKIATKPDSNKKPTAEQRKFRDELGKHAWPLIVEKLPSSDTQEKLGHFKKKWNSKIHPYSDKNFDGKPINLKGRFYKAFVGDKMPEHLRDDDYKQIAKKLDKHLHVSAFAARNMTMEKPKGRIEAALQSIENNVLGEQKKKEKVSWSPETVQEYKQRYKGDLAAEIIQKIDQKIDSYKKFNEKNNSHKKINSRETFEQAVIILKEVYPFIFPKANGGALTIREARDDHPELFALHSAIKETYRSILKDSRAKLEYKNIRLPKNWEALLSLVNSKASNRDINATIRLGRIIHYESGETNALDWIVDHHSEDLLEKSRFWLSDGQAEIKRNEALVRIWRHIIAIGTQTLVDWAKSSNSDILLANNIILAIGQDTFDDDCFVRKLPVLFGERAKTLAGDDENNRGILEIALKGWSKLRNDSFHFKNAIKLLSTLKTIHELELNNDRQIPNSINKLWITDYSDRQNRLLATMLAVHCENYFTQEQADKFAIDNLSAPPRTIPLPRFRRILDRSEKAKLYGVKLPVPHNQLEYQNNEWLHCQHITLKIFYERAFSFWLGEQSTENINLWIKQSVDRATKAARMINKDSDDVIVARADELVKLSAGQNINEFFQQLTASTATEMRVQSDYDSNPENARKQAQYIGNLECDVIALAFCAFLTEQKLTWLTANERESLSQKCVIKDIPKEMKESPNENDTHNEWMKILYFLIHLVPVEDINHFHHQLIKNMCLQEDKTSKILIQDLLIVLQLYMDMHDAQFVGDQPHEDKFTDFVDFFETPELFKKIFPDAPDKQDDINKPSYRGLREMRRFGSQNALMDIFEKNPVRETHYNNWLKSAETIANDQETRAKLHEKWARSSKGSKSKGDFSESDVDQYDKVLKIVNNYRYARHHLHLINHVRLHRLLMKILGRLVDYSGLWERDLYFIILATLYRKKIQSWESVINLVGYNALFKGQIMKAYGDIHPTNLGVKDEINDKFFMSDNHSLNEPMLRRIRNNFAHFNMLRSQNGLINLNITCEVNKARQLMAYDRKLKNAVSKSIIDILQREGFDLKWSVENHNLCNAIISTRTINHLGKKSLVEHLHNEDYTKMVAEIFGGQVEKPKHQK